MKDKDKTKEQLLIELNALRKKLTRNEQSNSEKSAINNKNNGNDFNLYENHYSTLVETVPLGIQDTDVFGNILFGNTAYHKQYGYPVGELIGKSVFDLISTEEEKEEIRNHLVFLVNNQPPPTPIFGKNITKQGKTIDIEVAWNYKRDKAGQVIGFISIIKDITNRLKREQDLKNTQGELYKSQAKTAALLNAVSESALLLDSQGTVLELNKTAAQRLGKTPDEIIGRNAYDLFPKKLAESRFKIASEVIDSGKPIQFEDKRGDRFLSNTIYPVIDKDGKVDKLAIYSRDITKERKAEDILKRSHDKLEKLVEERTKSLKETLKLMRQEIVDRRLVEKKLIKSKNIIENQSKMLIEAQRLANLGSWNWDMENNKVTVSKEAYRIVGIDKESSFKSAGSYMKLVHPDDNEYVSQAMLDLIETGGNAEFQYRIIRPDGIERVLRACSTIEYNADGNPSRMIGAVLDITKLIKNENELIKSKYIIEDQSKILIEAQRLAHFGSWKWDIENDKVTVSKEGYRILGIDKESSYRSAGSFLKIIHSDDIENLKRVVQDLIKTGGSAEYDCRIIHPIGNERLMRGWSTIEYNAHGSPSKMIGGILDITEITLQKKVLQNLVTGFAAIRGKEFFNKVSAYLAETLSMDYAYVGELLEDEMIRVIGGVCKGKTLEPFEYALKDTPSEIVMRQTLCSYPSNVQERFPKDQLLIDMNINGYVGCALMDADGNSIGIIVLINGQPFTNCQIAESTLQIFSERVSAEVQRLASESKLANSELKLRSFFDMAPVGIALNNMQGKFIEVNHEFSRFTGYTVDELNELSYWELTPEEYNDQEQIQLDSLAKRNMYGPYVKEYIHKNGHRYPVLLNGIKLKDQTGEEFIWSVVQDITKEKEKEEKLRKSMERATLLSSILSLSSVPKATIEEVCAYTIEQLSQYAGWPVAHVYFYEKETNVLIPSEIWYFDTGIDKEVVNNFKKISKKTNFELGKGLPGRVWKSEKTAWITNVNEDYSFPGNKQQAKQLEIKGAFAFPVTANNEVVAVLEFYTTVVEDKDKEMISLSEEISKQLSIVFERVITNRVIRKSEELLKKIFERSNIGIAYANKNGELTNFNKEFVNIVGYAKEELTGMNLSKFTHPDDLPKEMILLNQLFEGTSDGYRMEKRYITKKGEIKWVDLSVAAIRDENGQIITPVGMVVDITERVKAESQLRMIYESSGDAIVIHDERGYFECNIAALKMFRCKSKEEFFKIGPEELSPEFLSDGRSAVQVMKENQKSSLKKGTIQFEWESKRMDGTFFDAEVLLTPMKLEKKNVFQAIVRDITKRKQADKLLKKSKEKLRALASRIENIREEERIYISREIHDDLGHSLTALLIDLHSLGTGRGFQNKELANELKPMISLVNHSIETIRKIASNLRPGILDKLGLGAALQWELEEFKKRNKMVCIANIEEETTKRLNMEITTALFRIFQEILTNISRHANATKMTAVLKIENKKIKLFVSDNGRGITKENLDNINSLGILGMQERTKILGGEFFISGSKQMGTEVSVIIPME